MNINKINTYLIIQVIKNFLLILFIFLSIAWLLQITRLFTVTNFMQVSIMDVIYLSLHLIPNIFTVIAPFILIFSLLLCFIRLNRENELITILTLGLGLRPFKITLLFFTFTLIFIFAFLNFYLAPKIYEKYKIEENNLRNTIDFNNMVFSNFLNLNNTTILDFKKNNNIYEDILISFKDEKENIVYAKKGNIYSDNEQYKFQLSEGFKISIDDQKQIEKLEFLDYVLKIENKNVNKDIVLDNNTFTIFDDINSRNYLNLAFKIFDIIIILFIIFFFYNNNLKKINFNTSNNIYFCILCISEILLNQILKNAEIFLVNYISFLIAFILFSLIISNIKKRYEKN